MLGNILLTIAVICTIFSYLPQVIKTLKTKSSEDISVTSWIIWIVSTLCYISYAIFVSQDPMLVLSTSVELFFCILILILAIKYRNS